MGEQPASPVRPLPPEVEALLAPFSAEVTALARALRTLVLEEAPEVHQTAWDAYNAVSLVYSFTPRWQDGFCRVAVYARRVDLGLNRGSELPDADGVLRGSGRWIRHLRIQRDDDLRDPRPRHFVRLARDGAVRPRPTDAPPPEATVRAGSGGEAAASKGG